MRDNVSIIFAAIFAVLLLIVFPLFSLLTRQDSIAYNKVLTLTTEFVDSVRNKGYFTEQEYTNYLAGLSSTRNTYKVEMECHKKILIKDVNNYKDENPVWVEDTEIYYNTYVENELKGSKVVSLNDGDEFYIKLYNTNITTASLMYNFFLNSRIPRKIINIGYGGKILNTSGNTYAKTTFNSSYTPYITFGEVRNKNDQIFKRCYDREAGTYAIQYCDRIIYVDNENNNPIKVDFKMHNFDKIGEISINENFSTNKDKIADAIKAKVVLRGDYIFPGYEVSVDNLNLVNGNIEGTISIKNISIGQGAWKTSAYIIIESSLGIGTTGAASTEGTTEELTLTREEASSKVKISGPYLSTDTTDVVTEALKNRETVYYKITLNDSNGIKSLRLTENGKDIVTYSDKVYDIENYNVKLEKQNTQEYLLTITPKSQTNSGSIFENERRELQITVVADVYIDANQTSSVECLSKVVVWQISSYDIKCTEVERYVGYGRNPVSVYIYFDSDSKNEIKKYVNNRGYSYKEFFKELAEAQIIYTTRGGSSDKKYTIDVIDAAIEGNEFYLSYSDYVDGGLKNEKVYFNFLNLDGEPKTVEVSSKSNIPKYFHINAVNLSDSKIYINRYGMTNEWYGTAYYWIPATKDDIKDTDAFYDSNVTKDMVKDSINKYGGFYVAVGFEEQSSNSKFDGIWEKLKSLEINNVKLDESKMFSSMIYKWQLDKIIEANLVKTPVANSKDGELNTIVWGRRFWLAEKNKKEVAYLDKNNKEYIYHTNTVEDANRDDNRNYFVGLRVLYLK